MSEKKVQRPTRKEFQKRCEKVAKLFEKLGSTRLVCDELGLDLKQVHYALHKMGIPTPREGRVQYPHCARRAKKDQMFRLLEEGHSVKEIAKAVGTNFSQVYKFLEENGLEKPASKVKKGEEHPAWVGGRLIDKDGYVLIHCKGHPNGRKHTPYIFEHRLVMEKHLGRLLEPDEVVHHKNKLKDDNRIENLELFRTNGKHLAHELKGQCPNWSPEGKERIRQATLRRWRLAKKSTQKESESCDQPCK